LLGVTQGLGFPAPTDSNILNAACSTFAIWNYNASSTLWNSSATIPAKSAVWLQHFCN
jgi:hypothetical protein